MRTLGIRHTVVALAAAIGLALPVLADPTEAAWQLLGQVEIREITDQAQWTFEKEFPEELRDAREGFEIEGYLVPVTSEAYILTFLLVEDPADCPFCGSGGYGPVLEVELRHPLPDVPEFSRIRVRGDLAFIEDPETFQALRLEDAVRIDPSDS